MEKFDECLDLAKNKHKISDHMINVTYPLLRDNKLLVASMENTFLAFTNAMTAILHFERFYKNIPPFNKTFASKFFLYSRIVQEKFGLNKEYAKMMKEIKDIIVEHKNSPVEFSRKDKYIICSDKYHTMVLTYPKIREFTDKAKFFIQEIDTIINNERKIPRRI